MLTNDNNDGMSEETLGRLCLLSPAVTVPLQILDLSFTIAAQVLDLSFEELDELPRPGQLTLG
jgi:hypothetical protein